jgi:CheY-like chemotaxis protein
MKSKRHLALIASNNFVHRAVLEFNLAKLGFMVTLAMDAQEAFQFAEKQAFDLVITDYQTPRGTGVDLVRQLRFLGSYGETPMVLLADEQAELDLDYLRDELWLLVIWEPCNLAEVAQKFARYFPPQQVSC